MTAVPCSVGGCSRRYYAKGFCQLHWRRMRRNGTPGPVELIKSRHIGCSVDGCVKRHESNGFCPMHYRRWRLHGDPLVARGSRDKYAHRPALDRQEKSLRHRMRMYGLMPEDYERMLLEQDGRCAICGSSDPGGRPSFSVDHDHSCCPSGARSCGQCVRGLLCSGCNAALGQFRDEPFVLESALAYLRHWTLLKRVA